MMTRTYNPFEPGAPVIWMFGKVGENIRVPTLLADLRRYPDGDGPIEIMIESNGGFHDIGMDIYALLRDVARPKRVTVLAARSMAAVIAMAGDTIRIAENGHFFIHPSHMAPSSLLALSEEKDLTATVLRRAASDCDAAEQVHNEIFARRTGNDRKFIEALTGMEITLDARRSVELGFADEIVKPWAAAA